MTYKSKIKTLSEIKEIVDQAKREGKKVVLANGCFDLVHVGHIRYLNDAKGYGDLLIVAINSDESVKKLKGSHRPFMPQDERAEIIAALECVDYVFIFEDERLDNILLLLKPDYQAKGTDYTTESVPEAKTVKSYGGSVIICGDPKDHSSTVLFNKIGQAFLRKANG